MKTKPINIEFIRSRVRLCDDSPSGLEWVNWKDHGERCRQAVELREQGKKFREIAEVMGVTIELACQMVRRVNLPRKGVGRYVKGQTVKLGYKKVSFSENGKMSSYYLHRLVWALNHGPIPENMVIDHIDGNPSNNRIENLQLVSQGKNVQLKNGVHARNTTGFANVRYNPKLQKRPYTAEFTRSGVRIPVGSFKTAEEAARARDAAIREWHRKQGEEARYMNFPIATPIAMP